MTITPRRSQSRDGSPGVAGRLPKGGRPAALLGLIAVSLAGTADVAEFLASRTTMFADAPGRAAGSVVGLALWVALLGIATTRYARVGRAWASSATLALAGLVAAGNVGLTAIHLKAGVGGLRPLAGGILGILALILALASQDRSRATGSVA